MVGDPLRLTCRVNRVTLEITWMKNGASKIGPRKGNESTLYIDKVVLDDSGNYSCKAHNRAGNVSSTVKITDSGKQYLNEERWYGDFVAGQTGYLSHDKLQEINFCFYLSTLKWKKTKADELRYLYEITG